MKKILFILFIYFYINVNETNISFGTTQVFAETSYLLTKTTECKPKTPETIFSMMDSAICEFNSILIKPIKKCYSSFGSNSLQGLKCAIGITEKLKSLKPEYCSSKELSAEQSIVCKTAESVQKVADCYDDKGVGEARKCAVKEIKDFHKDIQETGKTIFSNAKESITDNPKYPIWAAEGNRDSISIEILNPYPKASPMAPAIKKIQAEIATYSGRGFDGEYTLAVKNDAIEQQKMEEERIERERLERIAQAERDRQERITQLKRRAEQAQERYARAKHSGPNSSGCRDWQRANQAGRGVNQILSAGGVDTSLGDKLLDASEAGAAICKFVDQPTLANYLNMAKESQEAYESATNQGGSNSSAQDDGCIRVKAQCPGQKAALERILKSRGPESDEAEANLEKLRGICAPCGYNW